MPIHLALVALFSLPLPWGHGHAHIPQPQGWPRHYGEWTLNVRTDSFTTGHVCKLTRPGIDYQRQTVILHLPARTDTTNAVYRIDAGPPVEARADDLQIVRLGFALQDDDLQNPSGGVIRIPVTRLVGARSVRVETAAFSRSRKFDLDGLDAALAAANAANCGPNDFQ